MEEILNLIDQIEGGMYDDKLSDVHAALVEANSALQKRAKVINFEKTLETVQSMAPGVKVALSGLKPKYVNGATATVVKVNRTRAIVMMDKRVGNYAGNVSVPLSCLTVVNEEVAA